MNICLNAGHTINGYGYGAIGYMDESKEARKVVKVLKGYLEAKGHKVVINNIDKATSQNAYLKEVVKGANNSKCDLFISIHFNAGGGTGCECYTWKGKKLSSAVDICEELNKLGFRNRGVKDGGKLYVIKKTNMKAVLVEICFVDNLKDYELYKKIGVNKIAQAIANGI